MEKEKNFQGEKILVVDDDMINAVEGMRAVEESGGEPEGALGVEPALELIEKKNYLMVLTDMEMQGDQEAGKKVVCECIKKGIPVAVVTSGWSHHHHHHHHGKMVSVYVPNSANPEELIELTSLPGEKDQENWKEALMKAKEEYPLRARQRYRKFTGKGFVRKEEHV